MNNELSGQFFLPQYVYHGTVSKCIKGFERRILDKSFWRPTDRDFGAGFYTTISEKQAKDWAFKAAMKDPDIYSNPAVLKIQIIPMNLPKEIRSLIFLGHTSPEWTKFIIDHRLECLSGYCPCGVGQHPEIVVGQMADNKMDIVLEDFERLDYSLTGEDKYEWFYEKITRNYRRRKLDALELGNQIVFCDDNLNEALLLYSSSTYDTNKKGWVEHEYETN
ncbi:DUF3990 domain-containing protein [Paenibacillus sp. ISL-20]|uniref:DUF3990 domain-containing protein n=1 Tax=Paenibacillus sp. ISL-20 TaxID=2819163 RepID=UPI001BEB20AE|nr:DUF3990 domain-containing protein [Paenibacillus sp. ISL-20]MBT2761883.1 DUF3990 domain-containing protein [Paenibacillus sp. ISL-20]